MGFYSSYKNGWPPTKQHLMTALREVLQVAGMDQSKDSGHSFRIGAATTAAARGMEDSTIIDTWKMEECHLFAICQVS